MTVCRKCDVELTDENWSPSRKKGNRKICKSCHVIESKESIQRNKDHVAEYQKEWAFDNKEYLKEYKHGYYLIKRGEKKGYSKGNKHWNWKGGKKLAKKKSNAKRKAIRKQFGFIPLNSPLIDGWVAHHIDWGYVIFIPEGLHKSVYHSVTKNINMNIINDKVYDWFINYYFKVV